MDQPEGRSFMELKASGAPGCIILLCFSALLVVGGFSLGQKDFRERAVEAGAAEFDDGTGEFRFRRKCSQVTTDKEVQESEF